MRDVKLLTIVNKKGYSLFILLALLIVSQGCVRYIPSREEVNDKFDGRDPSAESVGIEAFYTYDNDQRNRLQSLINDRLSSLQQSFSESYRIESGDKLSINVRNFEEISQEYEVRSNGYIILPFVGRVKVSGATEDEVTRIIEKKLVGYVVEPQVTVQVSEYATNRIWVFYGEGFGRTNNENAANKRTSFPIRRQGYSLVELLLDIGEVPIDGGGVLYLYPRAGLNSGRTDLVQNINFPNPFCGVELEDKKAAPNSTSCQSFDKANLDLAAKYNPFSRVLVDIEELFGGNTSEPLYVPLQAGDAVFFPPPPLVQVFGEVNRRGSFATGNRGTSGFVKPTLFSVIAAANGFTYSADIKNLEIYRNTEHGKKVVLNLDFEEVVQRNTQDIKLRDGDIIWIPSQKSRFYEANTINAANQFIGLGSRIQNTTSP